MSINLAKNKWESFKHAFIKLGVCNSLLAYCVPLLNICRGLLTFVLKLIEPFFSLGYLCFNFLDPHFDVSHRVSQV